MRLFFRKGFLFYAELNLRLFFFLLANRNAFFYANDLDTLPANFLASKIFHRPLLYDSHEYFTEVPELVNRKRVQAVWLQIERFIFPKLKHAITVCDSIAEIYRDKYQVPVSVVRNLPMQKKEDSVSRSYNLDSKVVLYQGALNYGRGLELLIEAIALSSNLECWIVGSGDLEDALKNKVREKGLENRIRFLGQVPLEALSSITRQAALGVSLEENIGLNYYFALPNKLFDYIQAGIPVLCSDLPEMTKIVSEWKVGWTLKDRSPENLAKQLESILQDPSERLQKHEACIEAAKELVWENEVEILLQTINQQLPQ